MCDFDSCPTEPFADDPNRLGPDQDDRQRRDLRRRVDDVAKKHAQRKYASAARPPTTVAVRVRRNAPEATDEYPLTCESSCEVCAEGPPAEQGDRSHADGVVSLLEDLGIREFEAEVILCRDKRPPFGYRVQGPGRENSSGRGT